jgi:hypothetical protein
MKVQKAIQVRHTMDAVCPSCEVKFEFTNSLLVKWFQEVKKEYPKAHISHSFRGRELQNQFYREGKTRLSYPKSKHNHCDVAGKPCSDAIDLFFLETDDVASFKDELFEQVWNSKAKETLGLASYLRWGGLWKGFRDRCHFEIELPREEENIC